MAHNLGEPNLSQYIGVGTTLVLQRERYFVEFGAVDGILHRNTLVLERGFGWSGILVEPKRDLACAMQANRTANIDLRCVWSKSGDTLQLLVTGDPELSTIDDRASEDMHSSVRRESSRRIPVETVSLGDLLDSHGAPGVIDYLSIDTEGTELEILTEFDWSKRIIRLVSVEHNFRADEPSLDRLMISSGYGADSGTSPLSTPSIGRWANKLESQW